MKNLKTINFEEVTREEMETYEVRNTARAVIFDNEKNIALMKVTKGNFYKLPGGGIDEGEDVIDALQRECKEEAGVMIGHLNELGLVIEIKKVQKIIQNSHCYTADVVGEKGLSQLTDSEKEKGYEVIWIPIDEAIQRIKNDGYSNLIGRYIMERELAILEASKIVN